MLNQRYLVAAVFLCLLAAGSAALADNRDGKASTLDVTNYGIVYNVPEMAGVRVQKDIQYTNTKNGPQRFDLYLPPDARPEDRIPVIVFINGVGDAGERKVKDWAIYTSWARLVAAKGYAGINFETDRMAIIDSISALFDYLEKNGGRLGLDTERIGVFACSANVSSAFPYLMGSAKRGIKAAALYYGAGNAQTLRKDLPVFHVLAGRDGQNILQFQRQMVAKAREQQLPWTMVEAPTLPHAFDALDKSEESLRVIKMTLTFWDSHLKPLPALLPDTDAKARQALTHVYGSEWGKAAEIFEELVARDPQNPDAWNGLARARQNLGSLPEAETAMLKAISLRPDDMLKIRQLGIIQQQLNKHIEAIKNLSRAIEMGLNDPFTFSSLGLSQIFEKQFEAAARSYERAAEASPTNPGIYYNLACAYSLSGLKEKAMTAIERAVEFGFRDHKHMQSDEHLSNIRGEARFQAIIEKLSNTTN
jgi:tetratricopeptide (TPR) repeat protein